MGNLVSTFFDEDNDEQNNQELIQPHNLEQTPIINKKKSKKNKTARKRRLSEKNNIY
jgi:hypothetical protein